MANEEIISQYIYPDNHQQQAEFVQQYRATTALKHSLLKEQLPNLSDTQIAQMLHEYTMRTAQNLIAHNRRFRIFTELRYHLGLDSLIRYANGFIRGRAKSSRQNGVAGSGQDSDLGVITQPLPLDKPTQWGSRKHKHCLMANALKRSLLKEILPNLSDTQIAELLHDYTIRKTHQQIARNHRLRFVREFLYHSGLDSLIRHVKGFAKKYIVRVQHTDTVNDPHLHLDTKTINKLRKTVTQIARDYKRDYKRAIKSPRPNLATEHTITVESQAS